MESAKKCLNNFLIQVYNPHEEKIPSGYSAKRLMPENVVKARFRGSGGTGSQPNAFLISLDSYRVPATDARYFKPQED